MTVKTEVAARGRRPAVRASGGGRARAPAAEQLSRADREARGKDARAAAPLESNAEFAPGPSRDPVGLLLEQEKTRVPELLPIRHGRMLVSPFTFYRGAALPMAADLATTPATGLRVQLCGDAHLSNFGAFASPARRLVFDVNDFDETLPGPFEWDVKRLAASLAVAGRANGFTGKDRRKIILAGVGIPQHDARLCGPAVPGGVVCPPGRRRRDRPVPVADEEDKGQGHREDGRQGPHRRQHESAEQAHHPGQRAAADHQRPPADRAGRAGLRR